VTGERPGPAAGLDASVCSAQGPRPTQEDSHVLRVAGARAWGAVFDGHFGADVAALCAREYPALVTLGPPAALRELHGRSAGLVGGACAVAFELDGNALRVANAGDAGLCVVPSGGDAAMVTVAHRLDNPDERRRLRQLGAIVRPPYVVDPVSGDGLMPTRSIGDHDFARAGVVCHPAVWEGRFESGWLIAACDGLWDVLAPSELPPFLHGEAGDVAERLVREALQVRYSFDNVTVLALHKPAA
jgi:serine/threonine protein phosphatase PrpC